MSQEKDAVVEGLITRMIDRIGRKVMAKDPELARLRKNLAAAEKEVDRLVNKDWGGEEPDWLDDFKKMRRR